MLYPKINRSRTIVDLGGIWKFKLGDETEPGESWTELQDADIIYVPASFNDQKKTLPTAITTAGFITSGLWNFLSVSVRNKIDRF